MGEGALPPRAYSVRAVAPSAAFLRDWSFYKVLGRLLGDQTLCSRLFISAIFRLLLCHSLGPFVTGVLFLS